MEANIVNNIDPNEITEPEEKLCHLLMNNIVFINNGWWDKDWPKDSITVHVNCNDIFAWGCADAVDLKYNEINELYSMWKKDETWGPAIWCIKKRKVMPQKPVEEAINKTCLYNLAEIIK